MRKFFYFLVFLSLWQWPIVSFAGDIFEADEPVVDGMPVLEMSDTFADIFEKLAEVRWAGKDIRVAIESIENIAEDISVATTDKRVVILHKDTIIGNWPRPEDGDWRMYGQVMSAMILKLREELPEIRRLSVPETYKTVVSAMMAGIDENGKYIYSKKELADSDPHVLTSLGIAGVRTSSGDYLLNTIFKGSQAESAGLVDGDILISANGTNLRDLSDMEVLGLFNGFSSGTIKVVAIGRDKRKKAATLRRASVVIADADVLLVKGNNGDILEIVVHKITNDAVDIISAASYKYKDDIRGIYLDLRSASGEDEIAMAKLAGLFVGQVPVLRISAIAQDDSEIIPGGDAVVQGVPLVAAVSYTTRGTAEGLAFALYENNMGVIIGIPTAGQARLATKINLKNGGALEVLNREIKSGQGGIIDGKGFFPLVCISNIRTSDQKDTFMLSVKNHEWGMKDLNKMNIPTKDIRRGCPNITSGTDEDAVSRAVAMDLLFDSGAYSAFARRVVSEQ